MPTLYVQVADSWMCNKLTFDGWASKGCHSIEWSHGPSSRLSIYKVAWGAFGHIPTTLYSTVSVHWNLPPMTSRSASPQAPPSPNSEKDPQSEISSHGDRLAPKTPSSGPHLSPSHVSVQPSSSTGRWFSQLPTMIGNTFKRNNSKGKMTPGESAHCRAWENEHPRPSEPTNANRFGLGWKTKVRSLGRSNVSKNQSEPSHTIQADNKINASPQRLSTLFTVTKGSSKEESKKPFKSQVPGQ